MTDWDIFWSHYPRRESKAAAQREYWHARRLVTADAILAGLERYKDHLPRDPQYIKKPANWLRDGDWDNEYDEPRLPPSQMDEWFRECQELHQGKCGGSLKHRMAMQLQRRA